MLSNPKRIKNDKVKTTLSRNKSIFIACGRNNPRRVVDTSCVDRPITKRTLIAILIASIIHDFPTVVSQLHRLTLSSTCRVACRRTSGRLLRCYVLNWNDCQIYILRNAWQAPSQYYDFVLLHCQLEEIRLHPMNISSNGRRWTIRLTWRISQLFSSINKNKRERININ